MQPKKKKRRASGPTLGHNPLTRHRVLLLPFAETGPEPDSEDEPGPAPADRRMVQQLLPMFSAEHPPPHSPSFRRWTRRSYNRSSAA